MPPEVWLPNFVKQATPVVWVPLLIKYRQKVHYTEATKRSPKDWPTSTSTSSNHNFPLQYPLQSPSYSVRTNHSDDNQAITLEFARCFGLVDTGQKGTGVEFSSRYKEWIFWSNDFRYSWDFLDWSGCIKYENEDIFNKTVPCLTSALQWTIRSWNILYVTQALAWNSEDNGHCARYKRVIHVIPRPLRCTPTKNIPGAAERQ
jgi:hypothetical protein